MKTKKTFAILLMVCISFMGYSHEGGHGHTKVNTDRDWTYTTENGQKGTFNGSFYLFKDGVVTLENNKHQFVKLHMNYFSDADKQIVWSKAAQVAKLNYDNETVAKLNAAKLEAKKRAEATIKSTSTILIVFIIIGMLAFALLLYMNRPSSKTIKLSHAAMVLLASIFMVTSGCKKEGCIDATADNYDSDAKTDDGTCTYTETATTTFDKISISDMEATFASYANVSTTYDDTYFYVHSNGIPEHDDMMVGITAWIAQVPIPHDYTGDDAWSIPRSPSYASSPISIEGHFQKGAIAIAANGIPIFNPINASGLVSQQIGELDAYGGHSGRGDDYHYHIAPLHLETTQGDNPIGFALDGFAIYASTEPDGTTMEDLDEYHGHEWNGLYHYHGTDTYPYLIGSMRGQVTTSGTAPEDQIMPQPVGQGVRQGDPHGISTTNLVITNCVENNTGNGYTLSYTRDGSTGSVVYSWDSSNLFTYTFNDADGTQTVETWQR